MFNELKCTIFKNAHFNARNLHFCKLLFKIHKTVMPKMISPKLYGYSLIFYRRTVATRYTPKTQNINRISQECSAEAVKF